MIRPFFVPDRRDTAWEIVSTDIFTFYSKPKVPYQQNPSVWKAYHRTDEGNRFATLAEFGKHKNWCRAKGKMRRCTCFIAIMTRNAAKYRLFPVWMDQGQWFVGSAGFEQSKHERSIASDALGREFKREELLQYIISAKDAMHGDHSIINDDLATLARDLHTLLVRRQERVLVYCGCSRQQKDPGGRLMWKNQIASGVCPRCGIKFHQKCESCTLPFDAYGGSFEAEARVYYSKKRKVWKACHGATKNHFSSAISCAQTIGSREAIIRAIRTDAGAVTVVGSDNGVPVRYAVRRVAEQNPATCRCLWGRKWTCY